PGDGVVVHEPRLAGDDLGHHDALFRALMRQHGAAHHVANGINPGNVGPALLIDVDETALVQQQVGVVGEQVLGVRPAADGNDNLVDRQGLLALVVLVGDGNV